MSDEKSDYIDTPEANTPEATTPEATTFGGLGKELLPITDALRYELAPQDGEEARSYEHKRLHERVKRILNKNSLNIVLYEGDASDFLCDHNYITIDCANLESNDLFGGVADSILENASSYIPNKDKDNKYYIYLSGRVDSVSNLYPDGETVGFFLEKSFDMLKNSLNLKLRDTNLDSKDIFSTFVFVCDPQDKGIGDPGRHNFNTL